MVKDATTFDNDTDYYIYIFLNREVLTKIYDRKQQIVLVVHNGTIF